MYDVSSTRIDTDTAVASSKKNHVRMCIKVAQHHTHQQPQIFAAAIKGCAYTGGREQKFACLHPKSPVCYIPWGSGYPLAFQPRRTHGDNTGARRGCRFFAESPINIIPAAAKSMCDGCASTSPFQRYIVPFRVRVDNNNTIRTLELSLQAAGTGGQADTESGTSQECAASKRPERV